MLTPRQLEMLKDLDDGEPTDFACYDDAGTLAWKNRDRVLSALMRKGLIDDDLKLTDAGRECLPSNGARK